MKAPARMITTPIPATLLAPHVTPEDARRAVRAVASVAIDAADCAALLEMLGLTAAAGKTRVSEEGG